MLACRSDRMRHCGREMLYQFLFPALPRACHEQAAINRFVGHAQAHASLGYWFFNHPEICSGDQSKISLLATISRSWV